MSNCQINESKYMKSMVKERILEEVCNALPHGSGFDATWNLRFTSPTRIEAQASFHCMDENGYYDGWVDFKCLFDSRDPDYFRFMYDGTAGHYESNRRLGEKHAIRDYIQDTVCECLYYHFGGSDMRTIVEEYV